MRKREGGFVYFSTVSRTERIIFRESVASEGLDTWMGPLYALQLRGDCAFEREKAEYAQVPL
jgi:hypothetical protein